MTGTLVTGIRVNGRNVFVIEGVRVFEGVSVGVHVLHGIGVRVLVAVRVGVLDTSGVLDGVCEAVLPSKVAVFDGIGVRVFGGHGRNVGVNVGVRVLVAVRVLVGVLVSVAVRVTWIAEMGNTVLKVTKQTRQTVVKNIKRERRMLSPCKA